MADPARKFEQDNPPGNVDSPAIDKPNLAAVPDGQDDTPGLIAGKPEPASTDKTETPKKDSEPVAEPDLYKPDSSEDNDDGGLGQQKGDKKGGIRGLLSPKKAIGLAIVGGIIGMIIGVFGWLANFKLDFIMSNIDKSAVRLDGSVDTRSAAYIRAYTRIRMMDINGDFDKNGNHFFRAKNISTGTPLYDWYKTLRTSSFESDAFNKNGIYFGSFVNDKNEIVPGFIKVDGANISPDNMSAIQKAIQKGDWADLDNNFSQFFDKVDLANHKAGRAAIKDLVSTHTQNFNVFKRRQLRKSIQNLAGVRQWRFFDQSRATATKSLKDFRTKLIVAVVPESTSSGKFVRCLFGISSCRFSADTADPVNSTGEGLKTPPREHKDSSGKVVKAVDYAPAAKAIQKLAGTTLGVLNAEEWLSTIESLAKVSQAIKDGSITASVTVARGVQAISLYQVFETARDQMKTGQVSSDEVNQLMQSIANITAAEAWIKTVNGSGNPAVPIALAGTAASAAAVSYCAPNHVPNENEFAYLCPNSRIGINKASDLSNSINSGVGRVFGPVLDGYDSVFGGVLGAIDKVLNKVLAPLSDAVLATLKNVVPSVYNSALNAVEWAIGKLAVELGAVPIIGENTTSGEIGNWLPQGRAYLTEATMRDIGARRTTPVDKQTAQKIVAGYQYRQFSQQSLATRYLSPSNPDSLVASGLFALGQLKLSSIGGLFTDFGSIFKTIASAISLPFTHRALAAPTDDGYVAAEVAGLRVNDKLQTYDFPPDCYNIDPLSMTPQNGTNIRTILGNVPSSELTWDLVTNSQAWYAYVYKKANNNTAKAQQIYNCNLLDNAVRGSLGFVYGYTKDNGLSDSGLPSSPTTSTADTTIDTTNLYKDSTGVACAAGTKDLGIQDGYTGGQKVEIRICSVPGLPSTSEESHDGYGVIGAGGNAIVNSRVSGAVLAIVQAAQNDSKVNGLTAVSSFRTMAHQQDLCPCNGVDKAHPGYSNHQMGLAIDFGLKDGVGLNASAYPTRNGSRDDSPSNPRYAPNSVIWVWLDQNGGKFSLKQFYHEVWHWSPSEN